MELRIVPPAALRNPDYFRNMNPLARPYFMLDSARAGLDLQELEAAIAADPAHHEQVLEDNDKALRAAGHWGVPTMVFRGEPFFGQDRFDVLIWRLRQHGLAAR